MNILYVFHHAGSPTYGMSYRPFYLAREWVRHGHSVTILGASRSHLRTVQPKVDQLLTTEVIDGITYIWVRTPSYKGNGFGRIFNMIVFVCCLMILAKKLVLKFKPDVIIASSTYPLDIYPSKRMSNLSHAKLVFEVHDLWPLSPMELASMSRWHPFIFTLQLAENYAYRNADTVISMLPNAKDHMIDHGMVPNKFNFVPNGVDVDEWVPDSIQPIPAEISDRISILKSEGFFLVGYAGGHSVSNALGQLIDAANILRDSNIVFVLVGNGQAKKSLIAIVTERNIKNIIFFEPISKRSIPAFLNEMDVLYLGWKRNPLYRFGICPNKLMDYMMAAKPVVHAVDAANDLVFDSQCGISIQPEDPVAISNAVLSLQSMSIERRNSMGMKGREYILQNHDFKILADKFISYIK